MNRLCYQNLRVCVTELTEIRDQLPKSGSRLILRFLLYIHMICKYHLYDVYLYHRMSLFVHETLQRIKIRLNNGRVWVHSYNSTTQRPWFHLLEMWGIVKEYSIHGCDSACTMRYNALRLNCSVSMYDMYEVWTSR